MRYLKLTLLWVLMLFLNKASYSQNFTFDTASLYYSADFKDIESGFAKTPDTIQTSVYWYWLSGNVSKEGVVKDLEAMKRVGINRAFIGDIGLNDVPYGKVKFLSEQWWEILHLALKTASKLNIEIGLFNGPGWSQAGGPWVQPEQAMRYLASSEQLVKGPAMFSKQLAKPMKRFQDVKVLAYPVPSDFNDSMRKLKPKLTAVGGLDSLDNLVDGNPTTGIHFNRGSSLTIDISLPKAYTVRSMTLQTLHQAVYFEGDIQVKTAGGYKTIKHFIVDRRAPALNFGFLPWAKSAVAIPATTSSMFRLIITKVSGDSGISELDFSSTAIVDGFTEKTLAKAWQTEDLIWNAYMWGVQLEEASPSVIDPAEVIDISKYMASDGTLTWKVPPGNWIIERTGMTTTNTTNVPATPEATGLETDKLSKEHIKAHFNNYIGKILERIPAEDRKTLKIVVADSYETGSQNWTDHLLEDFKRKYDYDALPFIPVLQGKVVGSAVLSDRFLWDFRRLIADNAAFNYVGGLTEISHAHGMTTWLENYGYFGFPGEFLQYGGQADEVAGEFWLDGRLGTVENRAAASAAHIYGKIKVSAESFTSAGSAWRAHPASLKARGDRFFADGVNNTLLHVFIHQPEINPKPGISAWFGTEFNRGNTWFYDQDLFIQYLKRTNFLLQQGQYVADAAYFIGEDAPKLMGATDPELPKGYSFDYINADIIKTRLAVKDGRLYLPNGISYGILVLPKQESMRPELLAKIKELVKDGAVVLGPKPLRSPSLQGYPHSDAILKTMADELWADTDGAGKKVNKYGKGMVLNGMSMQEAFDIIKVIPDFKTGKEDPVLFIHRELSQGDIYFISNQKNEEININPEFRIAGKKPELWDPVTGIVRNLPNFSQTPLTTKIPLQLAANESLFIVFRADGTSGDAAKSNFPIAATTIEIIKPWIVTFDRKAGGPEKPVLFETLTDWSANLNDSIKYYSGAAVYSNDFSIKKLEQGVSYVIELGAAKNIGKISVNGIDMGGVWTPPYRLDITNAVKKGNNKLEIRVVNNWVNRLLGDARLPVKQRQTAALFGPDERGGLESSGLFGPVKINLMRFP
ncbi:glycosyl hydrolase [Pedobacter psychroterrae]|uniref:Glycoside hydrolase family 2 n=1 Tax=Pedobacter psychroterrae TaxID=2530453 RepID=A0A4V6N634_9SPHI|nr:glycosyl hydrolase [Pedobacter psychroterrae]TCD03177.1 glycoside hydrolase family 2 [Pedobacter psychroterrae]